MAENTELGQHELESVAVTNTYRNQPLLFHVSGGSVRLGPCETREISRDHLASPELAQLISTGVVQVRARVPSDVSAGHDAASPRIEP